MSALVAAPAVLLLAGTRTDARLDLRRLGFAAGLVIAAAGVGVAHPLVLGVGVVLALVAAPRGALPALGALALGGTGLLFLLVRARHDPSLNQGDPSTWPAMLDVVARRQYAVPGIWPRRAPVWLQLANVFEWADWQIALGLSPRVAPSLLRTPFTLAWIALAWVGAGEHRRRDRRGWLALLALFLGATVGVALYLNLRAGPSFGWGILPDDAPHEPRERDYFFALGFWVWGLWAGLGAVTLVRRLSPEPTARLAGALGVALAALPVATNWRAMNRSAEPERSLAARVAREMLASAPPNAVLLLDSDNDTYPVWYAQRAERARPDVTPVTVPLLGAAWYRAEQRRRHQLLDAGYVAAWQGSGATLGAIAAAARTLGRPVAVSALLSPEERAVVLGPSERRRGLTFVAADGDGSGDARLTDSIAAAHERDALRPASPGIDPAPRYMLELLCGVDSAATPGPDGAPARLAPACKSK